MPSSLLSALAKPSPTCQPVRRTARTSWYMADQVQDSRFELFVAAPDGNAANIALSGTLIGGGTQ